MTTYKWQLTQLEFVTPVTTCANFVMKHSLNILQMIALGNELLLQSLTIILILMTYWGKIRTKCMYSDKILCFLMKIWLHLHWGSNHTGCLLLFTTGVDVGQQKWVNLTDVKRADRNIEIVRMCWNDDAHNEVCYLCLRKCILLSYFALEMITWIELYLVCWFCYLELFIMIIIILQPPEMSLSLLHVGGIVA